MSSSSTANRNPPTLVFRGDGRPPAEIFKNGFTSRGQDDDLLAHVTGGENLLKTGYISTSQSLRIPAVFMQPVVSDDGKSFITYTGKDKQIYTYRKGWVYQIKPTDLTMEYVPDKLPADKKPIYEYQQEWAVKGKIPGKNIKKAQRVEGFIRREDLLDGRGPFPISPVEKPDPFTQDIVSNPNYAFKD